jgi:hypothetical protein
MHGHICIIIGPRRHSPGSLASALHNLAPAQMQSESIIRSGISDWDGDHDANVATPNAAFNAIEVSVTVGEQEPPPQNPPPRKPPPPHPSSRPNIPRPFPKSGGSPSPFQPLAVGPPFKAPPPSATPQREPPPATSPPMTFATFKGWLQGRKANGTTCRKILSQHCDNTSKLIRNGGQRGGPWPNGSGYRCFIDDVPCPWHNGIHHFCVLELQSSFLPHDGLRVYGTGRGATYGDAVNAAALEVLAKLLCQSPFQVWLLDEDWIGGPATSIQAQATLQGQTMGWATPTEKKAHPASQPRAPGHGEGFTHYPGCRVVSDTDPIPGYPDYPVIQPGQEHAVQTAILTQIITEHHMLPTPQDPDPSNLHHASRRWLKELEQWWGQGSPLRDWIQNSMDFRVIPGHDDNHWTFAFAAATPLIPAIGRTSVEHHDDDPHLAIGAFGSKRRIEDISAPAIGRTSIEHDEQQLEAASLLQSPPLAASQTGPIEDIGSSTTAVDFIEGYSMVPLWRECGEADIPTDGQGSTEDPPAACSQIGHWSLTAPHGLATVGTVCTTWSQAGHRNSMAS